jgi:hypothetical protein
MLLDLPLSIVPLRILGDVCVSIVTSVFASSQRCINERKLQEYSFCGILNVSSSLGYNKLLGSYPHRVFLSIG